MGRFGENGAYLIVAGDDGRTAWVRRVPVAEHFTVYVDEEGVLRTDHQLNLWNIPVIRLHYRMAATGPPRPCLKEVPPPGGLRFPWVRRMCPNRGPPRPSPSAAVRTTWDLFSLKHKIHTHVIITKF